MVLIDERDNKIIEALRRDCRAPNAQIARDVGVSEGTIRRRLNRLLAEGAIEISVTEVAQQAEGDDGGDAPGLEVIIRMTVAPQDLLDKALKKMKDLPETKYAASVFANDYNIIAWVEVKDIDELKSLLNKRVRIIKGVEKTETNVIIGGVGEGERTAG